MAPLVYHIATSLDGFIARPDGATEGLVWDDAVVEDFFEAIGSFGSVLMGRYTYEVGVREGKTSPYPALRQIVVSRSMRSPPDPAVEVVADDLVGFVRALKAESDRPVWLCGGGQIAGALLTQGLIDRVVLKISPVVFGTGLPLFGPGAPSARLGLGDTKRYDCGVCSHHYTVLGRDA